MAGLKTYRAKRDFKITSEPRGIVAPRPRKGLRFVIQRHAATRLHYDFRLESDGVYKSWAVTKVPSLDPATKRLAVEVEDHPLEYGTFEGTIPEGQYGGGTVQLWDQGIWKPESDDPRRDLAEGHLKFELNGKRLHGGWALIRMRERDTRPGRKTRHNWLLVKEKDGAAQPGEPDGLLAADTSVTSGRTLEEIAGSRTSKVWNSSREKAPVVKETNPQPSKSKRREKPAAIDADNVVAGIAISNPEKVLWPATKTTPAVTKLDLARYYEMVAPRMLPHIEGRPLSMVRAPDGILGERFFQRHVLAGVARATPIKAKGEKNPFHAIESIEGLAALAQAAVLEIHPWGCKKFDPETPERLVFDLDPDPEVSFDQVVESATDIREVLTACGLTPFVKTTGGKGLHIVVAIKGTPKKPATWPEAKAFALAFAETVARAAPDRYTTNMSKKQRGGKIFLDYLRNDRTATAVGSWSPRARPGATIAMPIPWKDLRKGLNPAEFTLVAAPALVKRADPWKDLATSAASLETARKKLESIKT